MELITYYNEKDEPIVINELQSSSDVFIKANTQVVNLQDLRNKHIIPVFAKDNEPTISQLDFIETIQEIVQQVYTDEIILHPTIRVSHPIKGRVPEARNKPANELREWEKTIYYERMMFTIEIPSITETIDGNVLSLTIGGVKAYNNDNLNQKKGTAEHFKFFIGFQNKVCTNLCVSTDGYLGDVRVSNLQALKQAIQKGLDSYNPIEHSRSLQQLADYSLTEQQFANFLGRARMYNYLNPQDKLLVPPLLFGDQQINAVCKDYYQDKSFCKNEDGSISLWKVYNLLTGSNKSTYIDQFLDRSVNALDISEHLRTTLDNGKPSWYLS